jgi:ADP-heptose:LPS heptosyltransferase
MRTLSTKVFSILKHYLTLWHLKRALVYIFVDILLLSFVRRGKDSNNVLILKFDHLGDYIIARNFLVKIRDHAPYKSKRIILCANSVIKDLIEVYDAATFDEVFWIDRARMLNDVRYRYEILRSIKRRGAEVAIQCTYGLESFAGDCVMRASGARERLGRWVTRDMSSQNEARKVKLGSTFYTPLAEHHQVIFDFHRHLALFSVILPAVDLPKNTRMNAIPVPVPDVEGPFAILMPGASEAFREWPPERFAAVARHLHSTRQLRLLVLGTKADSPKAEAIRRAAPGVPVESLCGKLTLSQVVYMMSRSAGGVTNDSGGIHILAALGKPAVAVSNGVSFGYFHPYPPEISSTVSFVYPQAFYDLPLTLQERKILYGGGEHLSITDVTPASVIDRFEALLDHRPYRDPIQEQIASENAVARF